MTCKQCVILNARGVSDESGVKYSIQVLSIIGFKWYKGHASGMSHARGFQCKRCEMYCKPYEAQLHTYMYVHVMYTYTHTCPLPLASPAQRGRRRLDIFFVTWSFALCNHSHDILHTTCVSCTTCIKITHCLH